MCFSSRSCLSLSACALSGITSVAVHGLPIRLCDVESSVFENVGWVVAGWRAMSCAMGESSAREARAKILVYIYIYIYIYIGFE